MTVAGRDSDPSEDVLIGWLKTFSNWGRWGSDDELGALNFITADIRRSAAALIKHGLTVSCAQDLNPYPQPEQIVGAPQRYMVTTGQGLPAGPRVAMASEYLGMIFHGLSVTHLDSLAHVFWDRQMFNGVPADVVTASQGAQHGSVSVLRDGVVTRGVLLDVADCRGGRWLESGEAVRPRDLETAESRQGVRVGPGDAVLLRTGYPLRRAELGPVPPEAGWPGWHASCIPWLSERSVAIIASDTAQDVRPSGYSRMTHPIHVIGMVGMGLWLIDSCDFERVASTCADLSTWEFFFSFAPLRLLGGTGSPVNPIAVF